MARIARIVVDIALDREFDYRVPDELDGFVELGSRVNVPFGRSKTCGYVVGLEDKSAHSRLKPITSVVGEKSLVSAPLLELARWMAGYYCAPVEQAIRTILPAAVRRRGACRKERLYVSNSEPGTRNSEPAKLTQKQQAVLDHLAKHGGLFLADLTAALAITAAPVKSLEKKGLVTIQPEAVARNPFANRTILPTKPLELMPEQATALTQIMDCVNANAESRLRRDKRGTCRAEGAARNAERENLESGASRQEPERACAKGLEFRVPSSEFRVPHVVLLHGVTGSGKTEVYMQAIDQLLARGQGAIVLVPEISLTPQTAERFLGRFGNRIAILHSHLSDGERHDEWHRIRNGEASIVIGARSAVFAPVQSLGLIVVDEEHEPSYKQEDAPRYNARDLAVMRGHIEGCAVVLGSATPSLESWCNARKGKYVLAELTHRVDHRKMPVMRIVDMRIEKEKSGHVTVFSELLMNAIRARLERAEQTILFLNRRGFATSLICPSCGYVAGCDQCSVSYTFHRGDNQLKCHICGGTRKVPKDCPSCHDPAFRFAGIGTQRVERAIAKCFPQAAVQRMDTDVTTHKDAYDRILGDFKSGRIDILIGTQMIAKGLHFPNVTLVGVVYADLSLHMPDFRAGERTFQLLAQVAGRAGRGEVPGEVIVQTYTPFHAAIQAARRLDYTGFCDQELEFRRELTYPPYSHLVCLTFRGRVEEKVAFVAGAVARELGRSLGKGVILSDPVPAPIARAKGNYRYQVMLRSASASAMTGPLMVVTRKVSLPEDVICSIDMDAMSLL